MKQKKKIGYHDLKKECDDKCFEIANPNHNPKKND